ncbi:DUF3575 domain-containing protein [Chryseobacterium sp.]|uniref:DUF3575 domain-containing protein n=1 Tax=Chryseobacterium sp. TaxID=1871047 RepID=UPI00289B9B08|nr:DUF3575 domain-containing protein [Chryseobacterium sp.]
MKKLFTALTLLLALLNVNAQELNSNQESGSQRKNDIVIDPILLIAVPMLNVSYERILTENMGVGVNAMITLGDQVDDLKQFSPYFRFYMGKKYASGFFFEGFVPVTTQNEGFYNIVYDSPTNTTYYNYGGEKNVTTVGIGFGVGGKWVIKDRLVIEASGGIARRFGDLNKYDISEVTGKIMGGIGYRF